MIRSEEKICLMNGYRMMTLSKYCCDLCEADCTPGSIDHRYWLYEYKGRQLCWECLLEEADIKIIEE